MRQKHKDAYSQKGLRSVPSRRNENRETLKKIQYPKNGYCAVDS